MEILPTPNYEKSFWIYDRVKEYPLTTNIKIEVQELLGILNIKIESNSKSGITSHDACYIDCSLNMEFYDEILKKYSITKIIVDLKDMIYYSGDQIVCLQHTIMQRAKYEVDFLCNPDQKTIINHIETISNILFGEKVKG
jgi:hypothetical protein